MDSTASGDQPGVRRSPSLWADAVEFTLNFEPSLKLSRALPVPHPIFFFHFSYFSSSVFFHVVMFFFAYFILLFYILNCCFDFFFPDFVFVVFLVIFHQNKKCSLEVFWVADLFFVFFLMSFQFT